MIQPNKQAIANPDRIAAEGHSALRRGDTDRARACYFEAGKLFEASIINERKQSEKHLLRFLAASQYYHGGHYEKALALGRKIELRFLAGSACSLLPQFMKDATARAKPDYISKMRQTVAKLWERAKYQAIIEIFQQHPYIGSAPQVAAIRALCCEQMGEYRAAALFFGDAVRMSSQEPTITLLSSCHVLDLIAEKKLAEAREYLVLLLKEMVHPALCATVSVHRYYEASAAKTEEEQRQLSEEQIRFFEQAWDLFHRLPAEQRDIDGFRDYMTLCAETAALGFGAMGWNERALEVCAQAAKLNPSSQGLNQVREMIASPDAHSEDVANEDFRKYASRIVKAQEDSLGDLLRTAA